MDEIHRWLAQWLAASEPGLRTRGIGVTVHGPAPGTAAGRRPKATAVILTLESDERLGKLYVWESGGTSLLFVDSRTERTWQDRQVITTGSDLARVLAPLVKLVEGPVGQG
ncbi:hypothetical protein HZZ00_34575 [Streptomyces sp. NEAU-sy36]|uniref:hypothetical protein n=1 Tax=unclassified Streptomyces TaxID=2593676 RepID=UPI0015D64EF3|nr:MULTISPECIES: hypothetical protein [unclassified Streptomyces]QLJ05643.1 hypothetical protein HZZ00_34575 [Streptomyces sp. NEAU-sy36]